MEIFFRTFLKIPFEMNPLIIPINIGENEKIYIHIEFDYQIYVNKISFLIIKHFYMLDVVSQGRPYSGLF